MITAEQLKAIVPMAKKVSIANFSLPLNTYMPKYGIISVKQEAAFIAQLAHESGSLKYVREIASGRKYEGRKDLGNVFPGDGVKFKGRGLIQITGRSNYRDVSLAIFKDLRLLTTPDLLAQPKYAVQSACWFWQSRDLSDIAEEPAEKRHLIIRIRKPKIVLSPFDYITFRINGGFNGAEERREFYQRACKVLGIA